MKIKPDIVVGGFAGRPKNSHLVMYVRGGEVLARAHVTPRNPNTTDQQASRGMQTAAARHWGTLTMAQFAAWDKYARRHFRGAKLTGYLLFRQVQYMRLAMGLPLCANAPTSPPPPAPLKATVMAPTDPAQFDIQITHSQRRITDYRLRVDITPATPSRGRKPRATDFRMIRHVGPESFLPLQASKTIVTIPGARYRIPAGARFGLRLTILNPDGVPGPTLTLDLIR
ncbi:MAG: hypothetical protein K1X53_10580 [Candidatus Sumerlaeaceae bacterium]|nr:hypothetical protein [Candidatus Sumerlaeaceae bacterium]